jgi:DNA invertase Pin-like site-specific DNA recombinase
MSLAYREANREEIRARQRKYQAAKRARAKERGDPGTTGSGPS